MQEVMTRIELSGVLAKTYGRVHHRLVRTTAEAINALAKTINGFEKFLNTSKALRDPLIISPKRNHV